MLNSEETISLLIKLCRDPPTGIHYPNLYINESLACIINENNEAELVDCATLKDLYEGFYEHLFRKENEPVLGFVNDFSDIESDCGLSETNSFAKMSEMSFENMNTIDDNSIDRIGIIDDDELVSGIDYGWSNIKFDCGWSDTISSSKMSEISFENIDTVDDNSIDSINSDEN